MVNSTDVQRNFIRASSLKLSYSHEFIHLLLACQAAAGSILAPGFGKNSDVALSMERVRLV